MVVVLNPTLAAAASGHDAMILHRRRPRPPLQERRRRRRMGRGGARGLVDGPGVTAEAGYVHRSRLVEHGTLAIRGFHGIEGVSHRGGGGTGKREDPASQSASKHYHHITGLKC
jgi:hypothetical protein